MSVCLFLPWLPDMPIAFFLHHAMLLLVACLELQYYSTNGTTFGGRKKKLNIKHVLRFTLQLLSEAFLVLIFSFSEILSQMYTVFMQDIR
jgi:hypothetical protein